MRISDWSSDVCSSDLNPVTARIDPSACPNPFWLPGGLPQTIYGATAAHHHHIAFVRERVNTPDGDFLDLDWIGPGLSASKTASGARVRPDLRLARTAARRWIDRKSTRLNSSH